VSASIETSLTEADLFAAARLNARLEKTRPLAIAAFVVGGLLLFLVLSSQSSRQAVLNHPAYLFLEGVLAILVLLVIAAYAAMRPLWRRGARATLLQRQDLREPISYDFTEEEFRRSTCFSQTAMPWTALFGWREDDHVILVYLSPQLFYIIPKSQLPAALLDELRTALANYEVARC